ncbi:hypothetical protein AB205_0094310 [Aquarana catesbeiana]|uniref:Uncharacterized protein n=1 Tax=Aquarana catesbeiana TaxID=8400 RepID=A0A2G9SKD8_AQUCT|nr:hypothetical protein AB205_0094310 [Aquarana catesbeiana]
MDYGPGRRLTPNGMIFVMSILLFSSIRHRAEKTLTFWSVCSTAPENNIATQCLLLHSSHLQRFAVCH